MNASTKSRTSVAKFEEFFATTYKDDVFEILEKYPDERSLTVDYNDLEMFDPDLADLLIEKPEEVIEASKSAIKNIDPLVKDADINIRFENLSNIIPLKTLLSKYIGTFVAADGIVRKTDEIRPRIETGVFECRGCMRLHEVEQRSDSRIIEPSLCSECGGRSFRLLQEESKYIDTQTARMQEPLENLSGGTEPKQMLMVLEDDLVDQLNPGDKVRITGTLKTFREERSGKFKNYIYVNHIEPLEQEFEELQLTEEDEAKIIELSKDPDIYEKIIPPYRTLYARNRKDSIIYKVSVAYSPWMEHASLVLMRERRDCCRMKMLGVEPVITDLALTSPFHVPQGQISVSQVQMAVSQGQIVNLPEQTAIPQAVTERHENAANRQETQSRPDLGGGYLRQERSTCLWTTHRRDGTGRRIQNWKYGFPQE